MSTQQWLLNLLAQQDLSNNELSQLRSYRDAIQNQLSTGLLGTPRFYYGGSFAKNTMVRIRYDLDIVIYWPNTTNYTLQDINQGVGQVLRKHWKVVNQKTVSWELPFDGGFHIDVVPGRAIDINYIEANLYRTDTKTSLKTSLKKHIKTVRDSGLRDVIRLMKLWRERKSVPFKKSFLLEMITISACKGLIHADLETQVLATLKFIRDNINSCNISDPANSNNSLSDDLSAGDRLMIFQAAVSAIAAPNWADVFY